MQEGGTERKSLSKQFVKVGACVEDYAYTHDQYSRGLGSDLSCLEDEAHTGVLPMTCVHACASQPTASSDEYGNRGMCILVYGM